jgi:hypothetical protein
MVSMAEASLLARRQQEETFASVLARRLGPPGEAWEECARLLGLPWERFLALATSRLPRAPQGALALAQAFGLPVEVVLALAEGRLPSGGEDGR